MARRNSQSGPRPISSDPDAPFGYDDDGKPKTPYGLKVDGKPRVSMRGAKPGQQGTRSSGSKPTATMRNRSDQMRRGMLIDLVDHFVVTPLASASRAPALQRRIGRHADALAGDAFILHAYFPAIADGLILLSQSKPATLSWLDRAEENAPYMVVASAVLQMAKAFADNHMKPNPTVAEAGRNLAAMKIAEMANAVNSQAAAYGATADAYIGDDEPTQQFAAAA